MPNYSNLYSTQKRVKSLWKRLLNYFLRGLLVLLPIALTAGILIWIFNFIKNVLGFSGNQPIHWNAVLIYIIIGILFIVLVGFFVRGLVAKQILDFLEGIVEKAPILNFIFGTTRDMTEAFVGDKKKFTEPVLIFMQDGIYKLGFVTQKNLQELQLPEFSAVYLPYSYAISGEVVIVDNKKIKPLTNIEPAEVTKFLVSGGIAKID